MLLSRATAVESVTGRDKLSGGTGEGGRGGFQSDTFQMIMRCEQFTVDITTLPRQTKEMECIWKNRAEKIELLEH